MKKRMLIGVVMVILMSALYAATISQAGVTKIKGHGDIVFHHSAFTTAYDLRCYGKVAGAKYVISDKQATQAHIVVLDKNSVEITDTQEVIWQLWK